VRECRGAPCTAPPPPSFLLTPPPLFQVLLLPTFVIWTLGELSRFYFAYTGNLKERVPQMSAFLLMTIFPQLPCVLYLAFFQEFIYPFDAGAGVVMFTLLLIELFAGYMTLHTLIARQTAQFYRLCQEEEDAQRSRIMS
jgi:transmembrane protein 17